MFQTATGTANGFPAQQGGPAPGNINGNDSTADNADDDDSSDDGDSSEDKSSTAKVASSTDTPGKQDAARPDSPQGREQTTNSKGMAIAHKRQQAAPGGVDSPDLARTANNFWEALRHASPEIVDLALTPLSQVAAALAEAAPLLSDAYLPESTSKWLARLLQDAMTPAGAPPPAGGEEPADVEPPEVPTNGPISPEESVLLVPPSEWSLPDARCMAALAGTLASAVFASGWRSAAENKPGERDGEPPLKHFPR